MNVAEITAGRLDLAQLGLRQVNSVMQTAPAGESFTITNSNGAHAIAAGLRSAIRVEVLGHAGYYCAGMNQEATVLVQGTVGVGVAENMMSGRVEVAGRAGQAAGATAHGGLLLVGGDAAARCGISLKGGDIVVRGSVGHASAFMAQSGRLVVLGDAGPGLGDSIYEARLYVRGSVSDLGADCVEKQMLEEHSYELRELLLRAGISGVGASEFRRYGSARTLYHWHPDNVGVV